MFNFTVNITLSVQMKKMTTWLRSQNWVVLRFLIFYIGSVCVFPGSFAGLSFRTGIQHTLKSDFYEKNRRELLKL